MIPLILAFTFAQELLALVPAPADREFATLLESDAGKAFWTGPRLVRPHPRDVPVQHHARRGALFRGISFRA